jgi:hypothetical protein
VPIDEILQMRRDVAKLQITTPAQLGRYIIG